MPFKPNLVDSEIIVHLATAQSVLSSSAETRIQIQISAKKDPHYEDICCYDFMNEAYFLNTHSRKI